LSVLSILFSFLFCLLDRQYNGQNKKEKRIDRTDNTMGKTKRRKG
jgi:hypothetical protein